MAVNSDIIGKIRELAASGDSQATGDITQLDGWIQANSLSHLQTFEANILKRAHDAYELLSAIELEHLERLQKDRHRCAHPAFTPDGRLFEPSPEQVRAHLVNATHALFAHPPVQGRSALSRLHADVAGQSFPADLDQVIAYLGPKYLQRGKVSLVDNIVKVHLKEALSVTPAVPQSKAQHVLAAVKASRFDLYWAGMTREWPGLVSRANDTQLPLVLSLMATDASLWRLLPEAEHIRLRTFMTNLPPAQASAVLTPALNIPEIMMAARTKLLSLPGDDLLGLIVAAPVPELVPVAVERLEKAKTYREGWQFLDATQAVIEHLSEGDLRRVIRAVRTNDQIHGASNVSMRLRTLFNTTASRWPALEAEWVQLAEEHPKFTLLRSDLQAHGWRLNPEENAGLPVTGP